MAGNHSGYQRDAGAEKDNSLAHAVYNFTPFASVLGNAWN
jgi:hypothetical protein